MANFDKPGDEARRGRLMLELRPVGALQALLVGHLARAMGRLERVDAAEGLGDPAWPRAHANAERAFYRSLAEFRRQAKADALAGDAGALEPWLTAPAPSPSPRPGRWCCKACEERGGSLG